MGLLQEILAMAKAFHLCVILILAAQVILTTQDPGFLRDCFAWCHNVAQACLKGGKGKCEKEDVCDSNCQRKCTERPDCGTKRRKRETDACSNFTIDLVALLSDECEHCHHPKECVKGLLKPCESCEAIKELPEASRCKLDCLKNEGSLGGNSTTATCSGNKGATHTIIGLTLLCSLALSLFVA